MYFIYAVANSQVIGQGEAECNNYCGMYNDCLEISVIVYQSHSTINDTHSLTSTCGEFHLRYTYLFHYFCIAVIVAQ